MTSIPKSIMLSLFILGSIWLSSFLVQILLVPGHKTSLLLLLFWTSIYVATGVGLVKKKKLAFWSGLIISILQTVPVIISWQVPISRFFGKMPFWYVYALYGSAGLGIALLVTLLVKPSREFIFVARPRQ